MSKTFTIVTGNDLSEAEVILDKDSYSYDGTAKRPAVTVKFDSRTLTEGKDYTVSCSSNINAGTGRVTITGKGSYTGTLTKAFTIRSTAVSKQFVWGRDNWNFINSRTDFCKSCYDTYRDHISDSMWKSLVYNDSISNTGLYRIASLHQNCCTE